MEVRCSGFSGRNPDVWIERGMFDSFVRDLRRLERDRSGAAELRGMSPDELHLRIGMADAAGHVVVEGRLARLRIVDARGRWALHRVEFAFEVDPDALPGMVGRFQALVDRPRSPTRGGDVSAAT